MVSQDLHDKNMNAMKQYIEETRGMIRAVEEEMAHIRNENGQLRLEVEQIRKQMSMLQVRLCSGGATA